MEDIVHRPRDNSCALLDLRAVVRKGGQGGHTLAEVLKTLYVLMYCGSGTGLRPFKNVYRYGGLYQLAACSYWGVFHGPLEPEYSSYMNEKRTREIIKFSKLWKSVFVLEFHYPGLFY